MKTKPLPQADILPNLYDLRNSMIYRAHKYDQDNGFKKDTSELWEKVRVVSAAYTEIIRLREANNELMAKYLELEKTIWG